MQIELAYILISDFNLNVNDLTYSGGASTVKEQGHFEVRKSSSQVSRSQGRMGILHWGHRS